ncbi:MAG TPA: penicillin-binding protein 2 [Anaerolineae bacterium]|nr:penicillin-binding protein 2 [Anaerolineae bacterium]
MSSRKRRIFANRRILILLGAALFVLSLFVLRLWDLQIVRGAEYANQAVNNRLREEAISAPRGIIYDRTGKPLVVNAPNFEVQIIPAYLPEDAQAEYAVFARLSQLLNMPIEHESAITSTQVITGQGMLTVLDGMKYLYDRNADNIKSRKSYIKNIVDEVRGIAPYEPVVISSTVPNTIAMQVAEEAYNLPGVRVQAVPVREYVSGTVTSGILGYLRRITEDDLPLLPPGYNPDTDRVGAVGIEGEFEDLLRGRKGQRIIEEDVVGRTIRVVNEPQAAAPGNNLHLTLDLDLQQFAQQSLQDEIDEINRFYGRTETRRGAALVMNVKTGEILAMVSLPTYDNNIFSQSTIKQEELDAISNDPYLPQLNHAFQSAFAPGSVFKIVPASAGLQEGVITPKTIIFDPGVLVLPNEFYPDNAALAQKFYGWYRPGFGDQNVVDALAHSTNVFFYELGGGYHVKDQPEFNGLGIDRLAKYSQEFGFGQTVGIDLIGESAGNVPTPLWKRQNKAENWTTGDTYNFSIGQGFLTATPLQVLSAYAAIANNGVLMQPHVVAQVTDADGNVVQRFTPKAARTLPISPENMAVVKQGLDAVVNSDTGTGKKAQVPGVHIAGKTGTAEYCDDLALKNGECYVGHQPTHAWFAAYAPVEDPEIAVLVFIYNGGEGSEHAAPVAQKILQYYFEQKNQPPAIQTGQATTP